MYSTVIATEKSRNSKTGIVSATYTPIQSCPKTCPFLNSGCYAQGGNTGFHLNKINSAAKKYKKERPIDIAVEEAKAILKLTGTNPLRLHIVGDCSTSLCAKVLAEASDIYKKKHNQPVWTYTHAWRVIPRERWGNISVLASCETITECKHAMSRGYAASIVRLKSFDRSFQWDGVTLVPCLEMTKGIKCIDCKKCWDDKKLLKENKVICFFPHGVQANKVKDIVRKKWLEQDKK